MLLNLLLLKPKEANPKQPDGRKNALGKGWADCPADTPTDIPLSITLVHISRLLEVF